MKNNADSPPGTKKIILLVIGILFASLIAGAMRQTARADSIPPASPTPYPAPRFSAPVMPSPAVLADEGAQAYWLLCITCHGEKGQGLTAEWRAQFGPDQDCGQCHAGEGVSPKYAFPRAVPPLAGAAALVRFTTAEELKTYIQQNMPWWNPGFMADAQAWQLTAFLLRQNGVLPSGANFDPQADALAPVHLPIRQNTGERGWTWALAGLLGLGAAGLALYWRRLPLTAQAPGLRPGFVYHLHPPTIPAEQARWRYTLGAGGLAVLLSLVLVVTGALELFFYIPTPGAAARSVQEITFSIPFGALIRNLHFWTAQFLVITAVLHLARVIFTGAYAPPRRFNFLLGMGLFVSLLFLNFTGYILRWDEGIHWALVAGSNLLRTTPVVGEPFYRFAIGGSVPGAATLLRFYAWHIFGLTLAAALLTGWHIFRVRRDGGIAATPAALRPAGQERITRFALVRRETLAILVTLTALVVIAALFPAPLAAPIRETTLATDTRAPWFFLWVQQLLRRGDAFWMGLGLPLAMLALTTALPYIFPRLPDEQKGRWFPAAGCGAQTLLGLLTLAWLALTLLEWIR